MFNLKFINNKDLIKAIVYDDVFGYIACFNITYSKYNSICNYIKDKSISFGSIIVGMCGTLYTVNINFYNQDKYLEINIINIISKISTLKYTINYDNIDLNLHNNYIVE